MSTVTRIFASLALMVCWNLAHPQEISSREITALHWLPATAAEARARSLAYLVSERDIQTVTSDEALNQSYGRLLQLFEPYATSLPVSSHLVDGSWGYWVIASEQPALTLPMALDLDHVSSNPEIEWPIWQALMARQAPVLWDKVSGSRRGQVFSDLVMQLWEASAQDRSHAIRQAQRVERMVSARSSETANTILGSVLLAEAQYQWERGFYVESVWLILEGLMHIAQTADAQNALFYSNWLFALPEAQVRDLSKIDTELPLILALLQDSSNELKSNGDALALARQRLATAYSRLALFMPTMETYLDQPIRNEISEARDACRQFSDSDRSVKCQRVLKAQFGQRFDSEELVGANGPFSTTFLQRELGLSTWQRAQYLDNYVQWRLDRSCQSAEWFNVLEWSLATQWWQGLSNIEGSQTSELLEQTSEWSEQVHEWLACISNDADIPEGAESARAQHDLMSQLFVLQRLALEQLGQAIEDSTEVFYREVTKEGADLSFDDASVNSTSFRDNSLTVGPCHTSNVCGARIALPTSRPILDLVPSGYWMADQLKLGQVNLCYANVRWIDRALSPARENDAGVADYSGRLSLELKAEFVREGGAKETIFVHRYDSSERANFFFGKASDDQLTLDCAHGLEGQPIQSTLKTRGSSLVPDRLTYFTSVPTSAASQLSTYWERWQDALVDPEQVQVIAQARGDNILLEAQGQLSALRDRRERLLASRMMAIQTQDENDPVTVAMREVDVLGQLIQRMLELHYGPLIRYDATLRARIFGDQSLLSRRDIRTARDSGLDMAELVAQGKSKLSLLEQYWNSYPKSIRHQGLMPPELMASRVRLSALLDELPKEQ